VTGGLASGKSTLCRLLADRGLKVIDADQVARALTEPGSPELELLVREFGSEIVDAHGRLDRRKLAALALADSGSQARLHAILHPPIRERLRAEVERLAGEGEAAVIIEATLALEAGNRSFYDVLVVVVARDEEKVKRAVARGMGEGEARRRLALLWPDARKAAQADWVVDNDGSLPALALAADRLASEIRARAGARGQSHGAAQ
jgi:dephospho-CoA kinase